MADSTPLLAQIAAGQTEIGIDNADELLDTFLETFEEEDPAVQLQLLTATVKCFLKNPEETQDMVQRVLDLATEESDNPDLRDRGFIYWRLLSTDPEAAKLVVLGDKPVIEDDTFRLEPNLLNVLVGQIATLSSIYHKPPEAFVVRAKRGPSGGDDLGVGDVGEEIEEGDEEEDYEDENDVSNGVSGGDLLDMGGLSVNNNASVAAPAGPAGGGGGWAIYSARPPPPPPRNRPRACPRSALPRNRAGSSSGPVSARPAAPSSSSSTCATSRATSPSPTSPYS